MEIELQYEVNYLAVLVAAAAYWILGALWYSGGLFGEAWMRGIGKSEEQVKADFSPLNLLWVFVLAFITAYGIARVMTWVGEASVQIGLEIGLLAGVSFAFATLATHDVMESRSRALTAINALYTIIGFLLMGLIVGAWS
jgi:hypothetical protein